MGASNIFNINGLHAENPAWAQKYSRKHRPKRVRAFPQGMNAPTKVRLYRRNDHFMLQWWEPSAGRTENIRVNGDLLDALSKAREVDQRLLDYRRSGHVGRRLSPAELVDQFLQDAARRADAGKLAVATVERFRSALSHFRAFTEVPAQAKKYPDAHRFDREFALQFASWLAQRRVTGNGRHGGKSGRPMTSGAFVLDVVRSMYEWAADPERGNALPNGFVNPFRRRGDRDRKATRDPLGEPDITVAMAADLLRACDPYQLRLFTPIVLWGLRPSEAAWMFHEKVDRDFLRHECIDALGYTTKGVRNKSLPILEPVRKLLLPVPAPRGLILVRRGVYDGSEKPPLYGRSLSELIREHQRRVDQAKATTAAQREQIRDAVLHDAGGLTYKMIQGDFTQLATRLKWPPTATLKDLRHLCQTALDNGGMSREERQYLLGQSMGKSAITAYVHLNKLPEHYRRAVEAEFSPVLTAIESSAARQ